MNPKYVDISRQGKVFQVSGALTGTTIAAGHVAPPAAGAATMLSVLNPLGSGCNLEVISALLGHVSGTPGAGSFSYCMAFAQDLTTAAEAVSIIRPLLLGSKKSVAKSWSATTMTGSPVHYAVAMFPSTPFAGVLALTSEGTAFAVDHDVDGLIIVPPGYMLTLAPAATGTTHIVTCAITYAEVDFV